VNQEENIHEEHHVVFVDPFWIRHSPWAQFEITICDIKSAFFCSEFASDLTMKSLHDWFA